MIEKEILDIFKRENAILRGHFLLSSGLHSDTYIQCAKVLEYPKYAEFLSEVLCERFKGVSPDVVIGPAIGGITFSYEVARTFGARALFAERENGKFTLRRGFEIHPGERVLVVEDVVTTGGSTKEVISLVMEKGGEVIGVGSIIDRSKELIDFGVRFISLLKVDVNLYEPNNCPLCKSGVPISKPGSKKF